MKIGFIGQGWIGKNYANDFEARGYEVVRYALEEPYRNNKDLIKECDIVFIAVPTPTRTNGFDNSYVRAVLPLVGEGKIAVIKSTLLPGTTRALQSDFRAITVMHSPEFLREATAAHDAAHPERNIIGIVKMIDTEKAEAVLGVLPPAPYQKIMSAESAELVKYAGNSFLAMKVVFANLVAEYAESLGVPYQEVREALGADPRIGSSHLEVLSASGHTDKAGRGAGGHCFIKDLEVFRREYGAHTKNEEGVNLLRALVQKNNRLLIDSEKDLDLLQEVYGETYAVFP